PCPKSDLGGCRRLPADSMSEWKIWPAWALKNGFVSRTKRSWRQRTTFSPRTLIFIGALPSALLTLTRYWSYTVVSSANRGGSSGVLKLGALESALLQPQATFGGNDLYPGIFEKAAALGFSLIRNHPFVDGNKRVGHAAMEVFAVLNGFEISAPANEQEQLILDIAAGSLNQSDLTAWLRHHLAAKH